eukprot:g3126.t1
MSQTKPRHASAIALVHNRISSRSVYEYVWENVWPLSAITVWIRVYRNWTQRGVTQGRGPTPQAWTDFLDACKSFLSSFVYIAILRFTIRSIFYPSASRRAAFNDRIEKLRNYHREAKDELNTSGFEPGEFVRLSRGRTHYILKGPPNGQLVVLFHGFGVFSFVYQQVLETLTSQGYRVLCFDWYGNGYSDCPRHVRYDVDLFIGQAIELLDALSLNRSHNNNNNQWNNPENQSNPTNRGSNFFSRSKSADQAHYHGSNSSGGGRYRGAPSSSRGSRYEKIILLGHSMGGLLAANFARRHPERIKRLVLVSPAGTKVRNIWKKSLYVNLIHLAHGLATAPIIGSFALSFVTDVCEHFADFERQARNFIGSNNNNNNNADQENSDNQPNENLTKTTKTKTNSSPTGSSSDNNNRTRGFHFPEQSEEDNAVVTTTGAMVKSSAPFQSTSKRSFSSTRRKSKANSSFLELAALTKTLNRVNSNKDVRSMGHRFLRMVDMSRRGFAFQKRYHKNFSTALWSTLRHLDLFGDWTHLYRQIDSDKRYPILVLWGEDDEFLPFDNMKELQGVMEQTTVFQHYNDSDHFVFLNRPDVFNRDLLNFLRGGLTKHHQNSALANGGTGGTVSPLMSPSAIHQQGSPTNLSPPNRLSISVGTASSHSASSSLASSSHQAQGGNVTDLLSPPRVPLESFATPAAEESRLFHPNSTALGAPKVLVDMQNLLRLKELIDQIISQGRVK